MVKLDFKDDPTWDSVLDVLSNEGNISKFYRIPRTEMNVIMKRHGWVAAKTLGRIFTLTQSNRMEDRKQLLSSVDEQHLYAMLMLLGRSMKCWVETESSDKKANSRWKIANC
jgi:hypothetical protein